jgi:hypothetical protein
MKNIPRPFVGPRGVTSHPKKGERQRDAPSLAGQWAAAPRSQPAAPWRPPPAAEDDQLSGDQSYVGGRVGQRVAAGEPLAGAPAVRAALGRAVVGVAGGLLALAVAPATRGEHQVRAGRGRGGGYDAIV